MRSILAPSGINLPTFCQHRHDSCKFVSWLLKRCYGVTLSFSLEGSQDAEDGDRFSLKFLALLYRQLLFWIP